MTCGICYYILHESFRRLFVYVIYDLRFRLRDETNNNNNNNTVNNKILLLIFSESRNKLLINYVRRGKKL